MVGINNNSYVSQVPNTFAPAYTNQTVTNNPQQTGVNPFQGGDKFSVDNTSQAFDQAMAKLTGQNVFSAQTTSAPSQQPVVNTGAPQLPAGVTQSDMNWALALEEKVKQGYAPTAQETQVYQNIATKLSAAMTNPTQPTQASQVPATSGASQEEINWALALEAKVKQGYTPNQQETQAYQNIAAKMSSTQAPQQAATPQLPSGVSQDEINWALALEGKVKQGYAPNQQETQAYQNIAAKMSAAPATQTAQQTQAPAAVSQEEINWALALEAKVKQGYAPNDQETQAYQNIATKMASAQSIPASTAPQQTAGTQSAQLPSGVSQDEINWALALEAKVKQGYTPNDQETQAYQNLATKISAGNAQQTGAPQAKPVSQDEVNWALALEAKVKQNYTPTPQETATYQDIAHRLQSQQQSGGNVNAAQGGKDWSAWSQPFSVPKSLFETTPRIIQVPSSLRAASPNLPTYAVANTGPNLATVPRTLPTSGAPAQTSGVGNVSKAEVDWALALEDKVKKGYTPNESELNQYKNIAEKLQGSVPTTNQTAQNVPTQPQQQPAAQGMSITQRLSNAWSALTK